MEHVPTALHAPVREEGERCAPEVQDAQQPDARELLLMACHDVCAPLSAIRLSAQSLRFRIAAGAALTEERLCEALERVEQLSDDAARLMSDLLRLERRAPRRSEASSDVVSSDVDLEDALGTAISFHAEALRRARCTVVVVREEGLPRVRGRWARPLLESVFSNLLQNVGRHAAGARVTIELRRAGGEVLIRVSDSGSDGGPKDSSPRSPGHGLGMWIVRRAVAELGGRLSIDARAGAGVSVEIALKNRGAAAPT